MSTEDQELAEVMEQALGEATVAIDSDVAAPIASKPVKLTAAQRMLMMEDVGEDASEFIENSGLKRDRVVPYTLKPWMNHHKFTLVQTMDEVRRIVDQSIEVGYCSLDLETQGLDNRIIYAADGSFDTVHKIVGYCISYDGQEGFYIPVRHNPDDGGPNLNLPVNEVDAEIKRLCHAAIPEPLSAEALAADPLSYKCKTAKLVIAFWNAQFDQEFLYPVTNIEWWHPDAFEDGMLACFVNYSSDKSLGLKFKASQYLRDPDGNPYEMIELSELFHGRKRGIQFDRLSPDEPGVVYYGGSDGICTYLLCKLPDIVPHCRKNHEFTYRLEKQTIQALRGMERNRVKITREPVRAELELHNKLREEVYARIQDFAKPLRKGAALDPASPKQLSDFLFEPRPVGLDISPKPEKNQASGQYKTDGATLEELAKNPSAPSILKDIVRYREIEKYIGTYLEGLVNNPDANDELRFAFKTVGAATGRLSAPGGEVSQGYSGIPVHGIPGGSEIRRNFVAREGYTLVKADYAGEELRIASNVSGEPVWVDEFLMGTGDLHSITARAFFNKQEVSKEERSMGKIANFSLLYGGGPQAVVRATGCDIIEAKRRKKAFDKAVPVFAEWIDKQHKGVKRHLGVTTAFFRWISIPDANSDDRAVMAACERHAVNYQIQGAGADIMKISLVKLHKEFYKRGWTRTSGNDVVRMLLTVHDEIVFEIKHEFVGEVIPVIVDTMESPWRMPTPRWKVPLVVEPLIGFNWASGYSCERHKEGQEIKPGEYLINGYVYHTTRKPRKNSKDEIVESLDRNEIIDGKVFRIIDAPWLKGHSTESPVIAPAIAAAPVEIIPNVVEQLATAQTQMLASPVHRVAMAPNKKILAIRILTLNEQTVEQVGDAILACSDNEHGWNLHLMDPMGSTLIHPGTYSVLPGPFVASLSMINLIRQEDAEIDYDA